MKDKTVVLGVTGSIAAYKAADLCSKLVQQSVSVRVVMTDSASKLVTPATFLAISRNPVITTLWELPEWQPKHIALSDEADLLLIAPCTANFIGKLASGIADDALSTLAVSYSGPTIIAPAMNPKMWSHPAVKRNVETLLGQGVILVGPDRGRVACGEDGTGRMADVQDIIETCRKTLGQSPATQK
ncbi:MAG: phosphopantothenoylcysteine decarboxylase [Victivallales bacterium]|nr:phosphopantothenoylcysteine decarboxylase [Victivallales bacterium]